LSGDKPAYSEREIKKLARNFVQVVFGRELEDSGQHLLKWQTPIRLKVWGVQLESEKEDLLHLLSLLRDITGHDIQLSETKAVNFKVFIQPRFAMLRQFHLETNNRFRQAPLTNCFGFVSVNREKRELTGASVFINRDSNSATIAACLTEEITQGLGLPNDTNLEVQSVFNDHNIFDNLTYHDAMLVRALYDPRIKTGMNTAELIPLLLSIMREQLAEISPKL